MHEQKESPAEEKKESPADEKKEDSAKGSPKTKLAAMVGKALKKKAKPSAFGGKMAPPFGKK